LIEKIFLKQHGSNAEVELLFSQLPLIAAALFAVGLLVIYAGIRDERRRGTKEIDLPGAGWIGIVQGLCLPFRGFSRSGATISTGLLLGIEKRRLEEFSFALAVVLTPIIIAKELMRLLKAQPEITQSSHFSSCGLASWEWFQFCLGSLGAMAALALAGRGALEAFRLLLPGGRHRRLHTSSVWLLI
jgi:undecaprenyl-diphosphatase